MTVKHFFLLFFTLNLLAACAGTPQTFVELPESQLIESDDLAEITEAALELSDQLGKEQVLVVFDLDNTLLAMEQDLGSNQWYDWQKELRSEDPCNAMVVSDTLAVQGALYAASAMRLTQDDAPQLVKSLQEHGLKVFILTSRGPDYRFQTHRELRRGGFSFFTSGIGPAGGYPGEFIPLGGSRAARYEDGVFMTAGQHKGDMLNALLDKTQSTSPAVILMADDSLKNLENVLETFSGSDTVILAYRYGREDEIVASFNGEAADQMWRQARPALEEIEAIFGPDNYELPPDRPAEGCAAASQ